MFIRYVRRRQPRGVIRTPDKIIEEHEIRDRGQIITILSMASGLKYQIVVAPHGDQFIEQIYLLQSTSEPALIRTREISPYEKKMGVRRYQQYIEAL